MYNITSTSNKTYKFIKSLSQKKARVEHKCFIVEGIKSVYETIISDSVVRMIAINKSSLEKCGDIIRCAESKNVEIYVIDSKIFDALCDTKTPEGAICVTNMRTNDIKSYKEGLYLYCDKVSDPGNAGTLIRCADAVGAAGVFFSSGSVDIYNPKTVRATMGSLFHIPVYDNIDKTVLTDMKNKGFSILVGALDNDALDYRDVPYKNNTVIIVGNEANGVSDNVIAIADKSVIIPITGRAESLNVSVAGAILMYEWKRNN